MANIIVTTTDLGINVSETVSNITVTDVESNVIVTNVASSVANVTVSSTDTTVNVSQTASISNAAVRTKLGVENVSGYGNLAYDNTDASNGIFQFTGVSNVDIITVIDDNPANVTQHLSVTDTGGDGSLSYNGATGVFTYTGPNQTEANARITAAPAQVRQHISVVDAGGDGSISYTELSGVITYSGPSAAETRAHFSDGYGITYNSSTGVIETANSDVRGLISGVSPITYNSSTGAIGLEQTLDDLTLKKYQETIVDAGNVSGTATFNITNGTVHTANVTGNITNISLTNISTGGSATLFLKQDAVGGHVLDTSSFTGTWEFINNNKLLDTNPNSVSVVSVFYDGTTNFATVVDLIQTTEFITVNGTTINIGDSGNITTQPVDLTVTANALIMQGNDGGDGGNVDNGGIISFTKDEFAVSSLQGHIFKSGTQEDLVFSSETGYQFIVDNADATRSDQSFKITALQGNIPPIFEVDAFGNTSVDLRSSGAVDFGSKFIVGELLTSGSRSEYLVVDKNQVLAGGNLQTNSHLITNHITPLSNGNVEVAGNLNVQGNLNYVNVEDLLVNDQSITLNYGNASARDVFIISDRSGSALTNTAIKWNETTDKWQFSNDGSTYNDMLTLADIPADAVTSVNGQTGVVVLDTDDIAEGSANLYYTTGRANSAIGAYQGDINTAGNITAGYFIGDGSLLTNISGANVSTVDESRTVVKTVIAGEDLAKGDAVYISGGTGDNPEVSKADADDATKMPVFGVTTEAVTATNTTDIVIYGLLTSYDTTGFTTGDSLFVSTTAGELTTTKPTGESALLQTVGKVIKGNSSGGKITITGAGRTNATPNLNEGNIFLGSSSDTAITVTPDSNFDTTGNAFSLSNALTDVNTITTESGSGLTFNSDDGTIVTSKFGVNSTVTETANIAGKGFGVFNFTNGTNTSISYSGTDSFEWYEIDGNVTVGSTTMTISSVVRGIDSTTAAVSDIIVGQVIANGTSASTPGSTDLIIFPDDAYVVSVDSGAGTVEMSKPAVQTTSFTHTTDGIILDAGLVDTTTGQVIKLLSSLRAIGSGSDSALFFRSIRNFPFGYPASGPVPTDFDIITTGTASDYSMTLSTFMLGQTPVTNDTTVLNSPLGITIGENTQLTNRGENDILSSFGMNMMWDGLTSYGRPIQPQVLFKSYTDNSEQGEVGSIGGAGPRLFFTSANGNSGDNAFDTYPRANQELGRLSFWGTTGEQLTPSSYSVPSYMSVQAADDWDTWGGGVAGNTNVFMASTASGQAQTYLAFKSGELYLTGSNSNPVTFAPAQSVSGFRPELAYDGSTTTWANINYANTGTNAGAKFTVTNGDSVDAGVVGDMQMSLKRNDNSSNLVTPVRSILSGSASPALEGGKIVFTFTDDGSIGSTLNGLAATVSAPSTIDESIYNGGPFFGSGNETALGNNVYDLSFAFTSAGVAFYYILSGGSRVGYTDIGGSDPYYFVTQTSGMTVTTVVSSGVTAKEWKFNLEEQSDNLLLQSDSVTKVEFTTDETIFSNRVRFQNLDTTAINALTGMSAGDTVYNTTEATLCFYDGSAWQKVDKTAL